MILITGASGNIGRRTAELLTEHGHSLRLLVRDPNRAPQLSMSQVVQGDYAQPATLDAAFTEVDAAFIVSGYAKPGERALLHKNAIDAAVHAQVKHLVYLSFQGASLKSKFPMSRDHYQTEQFLQESGIPFTVLRDNFYFDLIPEMFNAEGVMRGPAGNGAVAWVAREDVSRVAMKMKPSKRDGSGVTLSVHRIGKSIHGLVPTRRSQQGSLRRPVILFSRLLGFSPLASKLILLSIHTCSNLCTVHRWHKLLVEHGLTLHGSGRSKAACGDAKFVYRRCILPLCRWAISGGSGFEITRQHHYGSVIQCQMLDIVRAC
jgi:NAD(P)H-binding